MSQSITNVPSARSWKDISQPVKPRAMSRGGRVRVVMSGVRTAAFITLVAGLSWSIWIVADALQENHGKGSAAAKAVPMKAPELETTRDGVLDNIWLARTLELRPGVSLMDLDLAKLRARLLTDQQVLTASITRHFPDRLKVQITERMPIARVRIQPGGVLQDLLVARDGIVFAGTGHDPMMLRSLPWLDGVTLAHEGLGFRAMGDLETVAQLLAAAQLSAPHLYATWQTISLARLASDRELEVTTKQGVTIVFSAKGEFFLQLARLDYAIERLARLPNARAKIDLSLGREVPVTIDPTSVEVRAVGLKSAAPKTSPATSVFQLRNQREL